MGSEIGDVTVKIAVRNRFPAKNGNSGNYHTPLNGRLQIVSTATPV